MQLCGSLSILHVNCSDNSNVYSFGCPSVINCLLPFHSQEGACLDDIIGPISLGHLSPKQPEGKYW